MKMTEKTKKWLDFLSAECSALCCECAWKDYCTNYSERINEKEQAEETLAYIQQLESRLAQVERERDALMAYVPHNCYSCKHEEKRDKCGRPCNWEWRGVCPENTKEDEKDG